MVCYRYKSPVGHFFLTVRSLETPLRVVMG
jgi:hypothetical protein